MTRAFLDYTRERGNDLETPRPELNFPGLAPGDRWCVCLPRWTEARADGAAPPVVLAATNETVLGAVSLATLREYAAGAADAEGAESSGGGDAAETASDG